MKSATSAVGSGSNSKCGWMGMSLVYIQCCYFPLVDHIGVDDDGGDDYYFADGGVCIIRS